MADTPDLVAYLRARLDEEQARAEYQAVLLPPPWQRVSNGYDAWEVRTAQGFVVSREDDGGLAREEADWIAAHDPARILADIAAKRAILDAHPREHYTGSDYYNEPARDVCETCETYDITECPSGPGWPCPTVLALAQPYAGRPDFPAEYRQEPAREHSADAPGA